MENINNALAELGPMRDVRPTLSFDGTLDITFSPDGINKASLQRPVFPSHDLEASLNHINQCIMDGKPENAGIAPIFFFLDHLNTQLTDEDNSNYVEELIEHLDQEYLTQMNNLAKNYIEQNQDHMVLVESTMQVIDQTAGNLIDSAKNPDTPDLEFCHEMGYYLANLYLTLNHLSGLDPTGYAKRISKSLNEQPATPRM